MKIRHIGVYSLYIFGFIGSSVLTFSLGGVGLFPLRISLVLVFILVIFNIIQNKELNIELFKNKYFIFLLFWFTYCLLLLPSSLNLQSTTTELAIFLEMLLVIIFTNFILYNPEDYYKLYIFIMIGVIIVSLFGWINILTGNYFEISRYYDVRNLAFSDYNIPTSVFTNQNDLGVFLALYLPFFYSFIEIVNNKKSKMLILVIITSLVIMIFLTGSRGAILALIIGLAIYILIGYFTKINNYTGYFFRILVFLFFIIMLLIFIFNIREITNAVYSFLLIDASNSVRVNLIKNGFNFLHSSYGLGIGLGGFEEMILNQNSTYYTGGIVKLHNWLAEIFVESGYLVGFLYIVIYLSLIKEIYYACRKSNSMINRMIAKALLTSFLILFIVGSVPSSFFHERFQWLLLAFTINFLIMIRKYQV